MRERRLVVWLALRAAGLHRHAGRVENRQTLDADRNLLNPSEPAAASPGGESTNTPPPNIPLQLPPMANPVAATCSTGLLPCLSPWRRRCVRAYSQRT